MTKNGAEYLWIEGLTSEKTNFSFLLQIREKRKYEEG